jgi:hypothetical protein
MRTTVGPLPPAVYWRRRAAVLGALLLAVVLLFWSCSGGSDERNKPPGATGPSASPSSREITVDPSEAATPGPGGGDSSAGQPGDEPTTNVPAGPAPVGPGSTGQPGAGPAGQPGAGGDGCTDQEISVTPVPARTAARRGEPVEIRLKIRNASTRTCTIDVGADLQEIYIKQGAQKIWSSDNCGAAKGSNQRPFAAGLELEYGVTWNGKDSSRCSGGVAVGPVPPAGDYEIFGRLGSRLSAPVKLALAD